MTHQDIFLINDQLTEEELSIKNTAKDYCKAELMPRILMANRNEVFDKDIYKEMGALGFLGAPIKLESGIILRLLLPVLTLHLFSTTKGLSFLIPIDSNLKKWNPKFIYFLKLSGSQTASPIFLFFELANLIAFS